MTMITKNWRVVFRDTLGNEKLNAFCQDMAEGKKIMARLNLNMQRTFAICCNKTGKNNENPGLLVRMNFLNMFTINNYKHI